MFTRLRTQQDVWLVSPGRAVNGAVVDLETGGPVSWDKVPRVSRRYKNVRWAAYTKNVWTKRSSQLPAAYGRFLCRRWNRQHPDARRVAQLEIVAVVDSSPGSADPHEGLQRVMLWQEACESNTPMQVARRSGDGAAP
jgi:hypothetical protein